MSNSHRFIEANVLRWWLKAVRKIHVEWGPTAVVPPIGQFAFFIEFLKLGGRFDHWIDDCPLSYTSNNAPQKIDVIGSLFLSILSGRNRYIHLNP